MLSFFLTNVVWCADLLIGIVPCHELAVLCERAAFQTESGRRFLS